MKMDENLQNLSTNPDLGLQPPNPAFTIVPPYGSVEAKYDTFMLNFRLTGDPFTRFGYYATYRKFELKDKTEEYEFLSTVRGDVGAGQRDPNGTGESGPLIREHFGWSRRDAARRGPLPADHERASRPPATARTSASSTSASTRRSRTRAW